MWWPWPHNFLQVFARTVLRSWREDTISLRRLSKFTCPQYKAYAYWVSVYEWNHFHCLYSEHWLLYGHAHIGNDAANETREETRVISICPEQLKRGSSSFFCLYLNDHAMLSCGWQHFPKKKERKEQNGTKNSFTHSTIETIHAAP